MSMLTAKAQLMKATKTLTLHWNNANEHWNDPVSRKIEEQHINPLLDSVRTAIGAMETMGEAIAHSQSDCS